MLFRSLARSTERWSRAVVVTASSSPAGAARGFAFRAARRRIRTQRITASAAYSSPYTAARGAASCSPLTRASSSDDERRRARSSTSALGPALSRSLHSTARAENGTILVSALGIAGVAYGGKIVAEQIDKWQTAKAATAAGGEEGEEGAAASGSSSGGGLFGSLFAKNFYEGGFEDKMTRREAALILGIRESSPKQKVKEAHRRVLLLNHPDRGGSTHIATKINEAKEMLLPGAED